MNLWLGTLQSGPKGSLECRPKLCWVSVFRTVALGGTIEEMVCALPLYVPREHEPLVILFSSWLGCVGAIIWLMNSSWVQSAGVVAWALLWREHPPMKPSIPVVQDGPQRQFHLCSRAWKSRETVNWWGCLWIVSHSKDHSWLVLDVSVCQGGQIQISIHQQLGEVWRGQCGTQTVYK